MTELSDSDRDLAVRLVEGHCLPEIAVALGISTSCARERVAALLERTRGFDGKAVWHTPPDSAGPTRRKG